MKSLAADTMRGIRCTLSPLVFSMIFLLAALGCEVDKPVPRPPADLMPPSRAEAQAQALEHVKMLQERQTEKYQKAVETNDGETLWAEINTLYLKSDLLSLYVEAGVTAEDLGVPLWYSLSRTLLSIHLEENPSERTLFLGVLQQLLDEEIPGLEEIPIPESNLPEADNPPGPEDRLRANFPTKELPKALQASMPTLWGLLVEYLTLTYQYPVKRAKAIQDLFLESAKNGNTTTNPKTVEARFGITFKPGDVLFWMDNPRTEATAKGSD